MGEFTELENIRVQQGFQRLASLSFLGATERGARFLTHAGVLDVAFYAPDVIRLRLETKPQPDYGILSGPPADVAVRLVPGLDHVRLEAGETALEVALSPLRLRLERSGKVVLGSPTDKSMEMADRFHPLAHGRAGWQMAFDIGCEAPVYGLGEKFGKLDHRGELITSWNRDALGLNSERSYKNAPFAWGPEGWGVFVHTPSRVTHAVGYSVWSHRSYVVQIDDANLDVFLITGDDPAGILERYTYLTGRAPELPDWSYGVWMGRAFYATADELLEAARGLRERAVPCDVLLLDGRAWHKMETRFDFSWDPARYPDPAGFVRQVREMGFRLCLWEYPYISSFNPLFNELAAKGYLLKTVSGEPYVHRWLPEPFDLTLPHLLPSGIVDLTHPDAYVWYRDQHKALFDAGVAVMKTDYGESVPEDVVAYNGDSGKRLHNAYALLYNRCVYEATQMYGDGQPMVWGRAGWAGSQRYPVQWGGDPQCDWGGLAASIHGGLAWGMSGAPFYAHDIGGFYRGVPEAELYVRWAQAGMLTSHTRFHGLGPREPWVYGDEALKIVREWVEWRYRLIPYLKACAAEAGRSGMPVMRAMPLAFPDHRPAWSFELQYMFGPALLVAPVVRPGGEVRVYLPPGVWYDVWNDERIEGPRYLELTVPLERIPVYGREGAVLPLGPVVQHTDELHGQPAVTEVWVYGEPSADLALPGLTWGGLPFERGRVTRVALQT
ncbi:MAG: glycoside hydrolase family 31 protein [Anaerolineae bacterium]|nr:glycoside hydrolase family 31 protein [Anaerolineae bacterium]